jgi:MerR family transcriptional regulator/heat shock protein HspR
MEWKRKGKAAYMISSVAETYDIHPQTLRLYEREGLLKPSRSEGNTRLYTQEDLERLEVILNLTRDLGVNLAGVEVILNMRQRLEEMQREMQGFVEYVEREFANRSPELSQKIHNALVKVMPPRVTLARPKKAERKENL